MQGTIGVRACLNSEFFIKTWIKIMKIVMDGQQYQELEDLIDIFEGMFFDGQEVQCFTFIKEIADRKYDTNNIPKEKKEKMQKQLMEAFDWVESLNGRIEYKNIFLSYFASKIPCEFEI